MKIAPEHEELGPFLLVTPLLRELFRL